MKLKDIEKSTNKNLYLLFLSVLVGLTAGFLASLYRLALEKAETWGLSIYRFISLHLIFIPLLILGLTFLAFVVTFFMKKYPMSSGSGIPQVKGQLQGYFKNNWFTTAFAKFIAGTLAMFAGLSLGREGPSVQLGASMGQMVSSRLAETERHKRILIASGASAGLSAAFNAPLSGVMFTLEEVFKYFSPLILLTCMTSAMVADMVARIMFGSGPVFHFQIVGSIELSNYWLLIILGIILGFFGAFYNWTLLTSQNLMKKIKSPFLRVLLTFLVVGATGLLFPNIIGSGHHLMDSFSLGMGLTFLCLILIGKYLISMVSYASGVPGGIFFPLLVLGASLGAVFATIVISIFHLPSHLFANLVILAMAGTFTAIVRAPMTGILLLVEMTGSFDHLLPLALVSLIAYVVADLLQSEPIYDSLLENMLKEKEIDVDDSDKQMMFETIVQFDSVADRKKLSEIHLPEGCLLVSVHRSGKDIIPHGNTELQAGDYLTFLIRREDEVIAREQIRQVLNEK
ncbi:ClC family H(+)/Cl(-) exchange transporter [Lactococcus lactis]|uniref:ClC family H(+)/Cl(-) exchange transporter n=1 Tax=Lactococcus lactis TaxID=1358 RepID=UPI002108D026|nr:ClC family H(+)/Cl(-) exchange transporter [Lactococcus lactis]MCQ4971595.1 ClC family H(+)/Cl(-) exchange transporter [Lactococcus lactis]MCQ4997403.1 ClC family H(+)/Cl(-) exchange transporter [Lactococcus lactis]